MADTKPGDRILLKILSGVQSGAEVSLLPGEYGFGSGSEDDLQFIDVSLKAGHARLRVAPGKIEIRGAAGSIATSTGTRAPADGDDWIELEPLEIVTAGTMRFALGPVSAQWTTLADAPAIDAAPAAAPKPRKPEASAWPSRLRQMAMPALVLALAGGGLWYLTRGQGGGAVGTAQDVRTDVDAVRASLDQFPFGKAIALRREVDGTIFASGFVEGPAERRALMGATEKLGIPVRFRLGVLQSMREELDGLIKSERLPVTYTLSTAGELALDGLVLNDDRVQKFVQQVGSSVGGLAKVESRIRTAKTLLAEIEKLGRMSQIDGMVIFRLDGELIEANGILPTPKIDAWVGFLQSYTRRYAKDIGLRSYVQLQNADGTPVAAADKEQAVVVGAATKPGDIALDIDKLKQGQYDLGDIFIGSRPANAVTGGAGTLSPLRSLVPARPPGLAGVAEAGPRRTADPAAPSAPSGGASSAQGTKKSEPGGEAETLATRANVLITNWVKGTPDPKMDPALVRVLDDLTEARARLVADPVAGKTSDRAVVAEKYAPLLKRDLSGKGNPQACRADSRLTTDNVRTALFWLDLMSLSTAIGLETFSLEEQGFLLEAALNPSLAEACLARTQKTGAFGVPSLYLAEAARNPKFIAFVTRNLAQFPMEVTGANLAGERYIQTRDGGTMREGMSPDGASRLVMIGELGAALQLPQGFSTVIYGQAINWLVRL